MRIIFFTDHIGVRGTTDALFAYARYNETILGGSSKVVMRMDDIAKSDEIALRYYIKVRPVILINTDQDLQEMCTNADAVYFIKYGKNEQFLPHGVKTFIHCVFDMSQPHGTVYAGVSETLARKFGSNLFVPHMITLSPSKTKENLRELLQIPADAKVFGRYGGEDTFNLDFVAQAMYDIVLTRKVYFIFINTPKFIEHPRLIFFDKIIDPADKNRFICTCDAHIEASTLGHTFGLAMGEFSVNNKPIIAYKPRDGDSPLWNTAHLDILGDKAFYFGNYIEFNEIIERFISGQVDPNVDYNCYKEYTPEKVMVKFASVFK